jgi:hypothetical protein
MKREARPKGEARRTFWYVERAPQAATKRIAKRESPQETNKVVVGGDHLLIDKICLERFHRVAPVTLLTELPLVHIIFLVASTTIRGLLYLFAHGVGVAGLALETRVSAGQRIMGLKIMIKIPEVPAVGVMAPEAIRSHGPFMIIRALMTRETIHLHILKRPAQMAFSAGRYRVNADQRE